VATARLPAICAQETHDNARSIRRPRLGFQGAITDKVTEVVVLGPRRYDPPPLRFTTPDTFVAGRQDFCEPVAQLKRGSSAAGPMSRARPGLLPSTE
jgi:hypothetical protein